MTTARDLAADIVRKRKLGGVGGSTDGSRIIDRRPMARPGEASKNEGYTFNNFPRPYLTGAENWEILRRRVASDQIRRKAVANAGKTPLPKGSLFPPRLPSAGGTSRAW